MTSPKPTSFPLSNELQGNPTYPLHGMRDEGAIESALARPRHHWMYANIRDTAVLAAADGFGFTRNHGDTDGNKRIGFMATAVLLDLNGWTLQAPETEVVTMMLGKCPSTTSLSC